VGEARAAARRTLSSPETKYKDSKYLKQRAKCGLAC